MAHEDCRKGFAAYAQTFRSLGNRKTYRLQAKRLDDFTRMRGVVHTHGSTSVIVLVVHQFDIPSDERAKGILSKTPNEAVEKVFS
jgi:hypothetical protein